MRDLPITSPHGNSSDFQKEEWEEDTNNVSCSKNTPSFKFNLLFSAFKMQFPLASNMDNNKKKLIIFPWYDTVVYLFVLFINDFVVPLQ